MPYCIDTGNIASHDRSKTPMQIEREHIEELNSFIKKAKECESLRLALRDIASGDAVNLEVFAAVVKSHGFQMYPYEDIAWWVVVREEFKW